MLLALVADGDGDGVGGVVGVLLAGRGSRVRSMDWIHLFHLSVRSSFMCKGKKGEGSEGERKKAHCKNPPARFQLVQHHTGALRVDRVDGFPSREALGKLDHALGEANLPETLIALLARDGIGWAAVLGGTQAAVPSARQGASRGIVDNLVINRLVGCAQAGIVDGQEAELGRNHTGGAHRVGHARDWRWL